MSATSGGVVGLQRLGDPAGAEGHLGRAAESTRPPGDGAGGDGEPVAPPDRPRRWFERRHDAGSPSPSPGGYYPHHRSGESFPPGEIEQLDPIGQDAVGIGRRQGRRVCPESEECRCRVFGPRHASGLVVGHHVGTRGVVEPVDPATDRDAVQDGADPRLQSIGIHGDLGGVLEHEKAVQGILAG
jgi:hypothetical protein